MAENTSIATSKGTAMDGVASSILAWSLTFVEIYHELISMVFLLLSPELYKKGLFG